MTTKKELIESGTVSDQVSLVTKLMGASGTLKRLIPGGKTLLSQIDKGNAAQAVYNWLRGCSEFSEVKISLAREPSAFSPSVRRVHSFDTKDPKPLWQREKDGRLNLAKQIANIIISNKFVYVQVKPDGIYLAEDTTGKFSPKVKVTESMKSTEDYANRELGEEVPSPDWEPWIEFTQDPRRTKWTGFNRQLNGSSSIAVTRASSAVTVDSREASSVWVSVNNC